jgi:membrane associated rhomboid family serine protease
MFSFLTPWVKRLIVANVIVFLLTSSQVMPGLTDWLMFVPHWVYIRQQPWSFVTYMFVHGGWWHLFFNMISLGFFGPRVEAQMGGRRFILLYLAGGLGGALLSLALSSVAPNPIVGASGAIFGIELVYAVFWPHDKIYLWGALPVEARWLVIGQTAYSIFAGFGGYGGGVAHFAHLGGYAGAFIYLRWIDFRSPLRAYQRKLEAAMYGKRGWGIAGDAEEIARWEAIPREGLHAMNVEELDRVIAKAKREGVRSLSPDERAFLHRMSLRGVPSEGHPPGQGSGSALPS